MSTPGPRALSWAACGVQEAHTRGNPSGSAFGAGRVVANRAAVQTWTGAESSAGKTLKPGKARRHRVTGGRSAKLLNRMVAAKHGRVIFPAIVKLRGQQRKGVAGHWPCGASCSCNDGLWHRPTAVWCHPNRAHFKSTNVSTNQKSGSCHSGRRQTSRSPVSLKTSANRTKNPCLVSPSRRNAPRYTHG